MGSRLDRALEYARTLASDRSARPRRSREYSRQRPRQQGDSPLGDTATLPAGTQIARTRKDGHEEYKELDYDTVFPADCVGDDDVIIGDEDWLYDRG